MPAWRADVPHPLMGVIGVCLDRPGTVEVVDVTMEHTEGEFRFDAYAFRQKLPHANHPSPVTHTETLWELGFDESSTTIGTVCDEELGGPSDADLAGVPHCTPSTANYLPPIVDLITLRWPRDMPSEAAAARDMSRHPAATRRWACRYGCADRNQLPCSAAVAITAVLGN